MKNNLVEVKRGEVFTSSVIVAEKLEVKHSDLLRTIRRLSTHGLLDEIIESTFANKMNREYICYLISPRIITMIETLYLFQGFGDSVGYELDYTPAKKPDITYIIIDHNSGNYKIGCTSNIKNRLMAVQLGNSSFLEVVGWLRGGKETESKLHDIFKDNRINGEWFSLSGKDIHNIFTYRLGNWKSTMEDTLDTALFDLSMLDDGEKEYSISDFTDSGDYRALRALRGYIISGIDRELPYKEIYRYAKEEVVKLVDSLQFNRLSS